MIGRPKKKTLSAEERASITSASSKQTGQMNSPRTYDPDFPLFEVPVNKKVLIYIPNHTVTYEDGSIGIRMDKYAAHNVRSGKAFTTVRCSGNVVSETLGLDGSCPLCDATQYCWELYNKQYAEIARTKGIAIDSAEAQEVLKEDRKNLISDMVIRQPDIYYTFPIVVIDCEENSTKVKLTSDGKLQGTPMFYTIREQTYADKWLKAFDALEDSGEENDANPAGRWAILNFTYTPKSGQHNKRDSARNLQVTFVRKDDYSNWAEYFDKLTEEWTPEKAQDVLVANAIRDMDEMKATAEELIKPTKDKLAIYALSAGEVTQGVGANKSADNALADFGAKPVEPTGSMPANVSVGEMPANVGVEG